MIPTTGNDLEQKKTEFQSINGFNYCSVSPKILRKVIQIFLLKKIVNYDRYIVPVYQ